MVHPEEIVKKFVLLFKSRHRRSMKSAWILGLMVCFIGGSRSTSNRCWSDANCSGHGICRNDSCVCMDGWQGPKCQFCGGKVQLEEPVGRIYDGDGNYSLSVKCSWLINAPNASITLHFEQFATECGWDHLYVFDGDSVESPLLAVFSGLMYKPGYAIRRIPEITASSGSILVHFFSDDAYNMSGFNITYRLNGCPSQVSGRDCSGNGICIDGVCTCNGGWTGIACHREECPDDCGSAEGRGICEPETGCVCNSRFRGADCKQLAQDGYWEVLTVKSFVPPGSASHGAAVWRDSMYVIGGETYGKGSLLYVYDFNGNVWETPHTSQAPSLRYGHSTVIYGDKIFIYGGVVGNRGASSELWAFDISARTWENITVKLIACSFNNHSSYLFLCGAPLISTGHSATVVIDSSNMKRDRMIVLFGHSPYFGYLNMVQEYYFGTREWHHVSTKGFPVKGGYGHSAAYDPLTERIYVYGGVVSENESAYVLNKAFYAYEPNSRVWTLLDEPTTARYLHTATFVSPGLMMVFGGNTHNDTLHSFGAKCYSNDILFYDVVCDEWSSGITGHLASYVDAVARYGHSSVMFEGALYIYGGFDGQMLGGDLLKFTPGECRLRTSAASCLSSVAIGTKCVWLPMKAQCVPINRTLLQQNDDSIARCTEKRRSDMVQSILRMEMQCMQLQDCQSCVQTSGHCAWCEGVLCTVPRCKRLYNGNGDGRLPDDVIYGTTMLSAQMNSHNNWITNSTKWSNNIRSNPIMWNITEIVNITRLEQCPVDWMPMCQKLHTCTACTYHFHCRWRFEHGRCVSNTRYNGSVIGVHSATLAGIALDPSQCQRVCAEYTSCLNCTQEECIWCQNEGRCVDKNTYTASFPYGQCREWTTVGSKCRSRESSGSSVLSPVSQCNFYATCSKCRDDPACGWCDDGSQTGVGRCMLGGYGGPTLHTESLPSSTCPSHRWHFTTCPLCQCNGHASCHNGTAQCDTCQHLTSGPHCEHCLRGYWGNPVNGGRCERCQCNQQATHCHPDTGKCYCTTKGMVGDHCERCDSTNHYSSDPVKRDSCYYDLTIDYQFTFNLSKKEDRHFTQINFRNAPIKPELDADFSITCSVRAKMNITKRYRYSREEHPVYEDFNCTTFRTRFAKSDYKFGVDGNVTLTTFYVYVYDFQPPLWIQISFSQYPKLNLQQFFITFSSCFLLLLLFAAILWKIKQRYDMYRRRQRLFVEMEQMASRPFAQVQVEMKNSCTPPLQLRAGDDIVVPDTQVLQTKENMPKNGVLLGRKGTTTAATTMDLAGNLLDIPSPIALEPCNGSRAAVLSLLVRMPTGGHNPYVERGQVGLAIASSLVTLGSPRKMSLEQQMKTSHTTDVTKKGSRIKNQSQHPDNCI